jgi:hypothetical protein
MAELAASFMTSMFGGAGAAAAGGTAAAAGAAGASAGVGAAASGFSLAKLLSGTATVFSMFGSMAAGEQDAEAADLAAIDAEREKPLETLQGINRRTGIKAAMAEQIAGQDVAYAASGTDLSFGTPSQARKDAFREADVALATDMGTEQTRVARLDERAANYRKRAQRARASGLFEAGVTGFSGFNNLAKIGG